MSPVDWIMAAVGVAGFGCTAYGLSHIGKNGESTMNNAVIASNGTDSSTWARYQIRIITENDCRTLGAAVAAADDRTEAKTLADRLGMDYHYGVAIVDMEDGIVDAGECDGEKLVFGLDSVRVAA